MRATQSSENNLSPVRSSVNRKEKTQCAEFEPLQWYGVHCRLLFPWRLAQGSPTTCLADGALKLEGGQTPRLYYSEIHQQIFLGSNFSSF